MGTTPDLPPRLADDAATCLRRRLAMIIFSPRRIAQAEKREDESMNGTWHVREIAGKRADVYELPGGAAPRFGVLYLHPTGLETLVGQAAFTHLFDELRLACVCPHGQMSWWADRRCSA